MPGEGATLREGACSEGACSTGVLLTLNEMRVCIRSGGKESLNSPVMCIEPTRTSSLKGRICRPSRHSSIFQHGAKRTSHSDESSDSHRTSRSCGASDATEGKEHLT